MDSVAFIDHEHAHNGNQNENQNENQNKNQNYNVAKKSELDRMDDPPLFRFQCTKLRSWLIGYNRILSLHQSHLSTVDPETFEITNRFPYKSIREWKALPSNSKDNDSVNLQTTNDNNNGKKKIIYDIAVIDILDKDGSSTKLKFKLAERSKFLTELSFLMHEYEAKFKSINSHAPTRTTLVPASMKNYPSFKALRQLRSGKTIECVLMVNPFALCEWSGSNMGQIRVVKYYKYININSISVTSNDPTGFILYHGTSTPKQSSKSRLFFIQGNPKARTDLCHFLKKMFEKIGIPYVLTKSVTLEHILEQHSHYGLHLLSKNTCQVDYHPVIDTNNSNTSSANEKNIHLQQIASTSFVSKLSARHPEAENGVDRMLHITHNGILIEEKVAMPVELKPSSPSKPTSSFNTKKIISYFDLNNLHSIVRVVNSSTLLKLEFKDGESRLYSSIDRDTLAVLIYDACCSLTEKNTVSITETNSDAFRYIPRSVELNSTQNGKGLRRGAGSQFSSSAVEIALLKKLIAFVQDIILETSISPNSISSPQFLVLLEENIQDAMFASNEFIANTSIQGLCCDLDKKLTQVTISSIFQLLHQLQATALTADEKKDPNANKIRKMIEIACSTLLQSVYRIIQSPHAFHYALESPYTVQCFSGKYSMLKMNNTFSSYWAAQVLSLLIFCPYAPQNKDQEYVNKQKLLNNGDVFNDLVNMLVNASGRNSRNEINEEAKNNSLQDLEEVDVNVSNLLLTATSEIMETILGTAHDTTTPKQFETLASKLCNNYEALMEMLHSSCPIVVENTALLLKTLSSFHSPTSSLIRQSALSTGSLLHHFYYSIYSPVESQRFLSRFLINFWMIGPKTCSEKQLLRRMLPSGFLPYLNMPLLSQMELDNLDEMERSGIEDMNNFGGIPLESNDHVLARGQETSGGFGINTKRMTKRIQISSTVRKSSNFEANMHHKNSNESSENFRILFHMLTKDHALPDLIWNQQTRRQLRISLETELKTLGREIEIRGGACNVAWNHQQFSVEYPSLREEIKIGNVYMRLWIQTGDSFIKQWEEPERLFELLFRRLLCDLDRDFNVSNMCIRCLERLYTMHSDRIGIFEDVIILVRSMVSTKSIEIQHRLLSLVASLLGVSDNKEHHGLVHVPGNAEQMLNEECFSYFCELAAFGHTDKKQLDAFSSTVEKENSKNEFGKNDDGNPDTKNPTCIPSEDIEKKEYSYTEDDINHTTCSRLWYVAPAGKIPPPSKRIRGPFYVSEIKRFMEIGELHPHSLITAMIIDDYSYFDNEKQEDQIKVFRGDPENWKMIEEVWQLRWQLCMDRSGTTVHEPSDVSFFALRSLTRLVALHDSVDSRGVPYHPIPIAKQLLCGFGKHPELNSSDHHTPSIVDRGETLPIISQMILSNDSRIVDSAANLLNLLMNHNNKACAKLYLTGIFYFICANTGSDFNELAKLMHFTHLKQDFPQECLDSTTQVNEIPIKQRSILGKILPEGLLRLLVNSGPEQFSKIFEGDSDTPEVIWTSNMRKHLIVTIRQHLGEFPNQLFENTTATYEYCPMPGVCYERLDEEIFCHSYYLRNLCDEERFPDWPIAQPVQVFRSCLQKWDEVMSREESEEKDLQERARITLDLKPGDDEDQLRKAYRRLAMKYHPDKNPAGREMFQKVQKAFEQLLPIVNVGGRTHASHEVIRNGQNCAQGLNGGMSQMRDVQLLIKTQIIICKRYPKKIGKYKYPAYKTLLSCLELPSHVGDTAHDENDMLSSCLLKPQRMEFICFALKLVFQTCLVSPLNSNEIVSERGLHVLEPLLDFYVESADVLSKKQKTGILNEVADESSKNVSFSVIIEIIELVVRTIAGMVYFESGRKAILDLDKPNRFCLRWRQCLDGTYFKGIHQSNNVISIKKHSLEGITNMSRCSELQNLLSHGGILWPLVRCLLAYDPALEGITTGPDNTVTTTPTQNPINSHAKLASRSLGMLSGVMLEPRLKTPRNPEIFRVMKVVLTPPIALLLRNQRSGNLLKTLNSFTETPTRIWNVKMREELLDALDKIEAERNLIQSGDKNELERFTSSFQYSALLDEINVGGVYLRLFNSLGGGRECIEEIPHYIAFAKDLLLFIALCIDLSQGSEPETESLLEKKEIENMLINDFTCYPLSDKRYSMAVDALHHLVSVDDLIDEIFLEKDRKWPAILLCMLKVPYDVKALDKSLEIILILSQRQAFVEALTTQKELWRLMVIVQWPEEMKIEAYANSKFIFQSFYEEERPIQTIFEGEKLEAPNRISQSYDKDCGLSLTQSLEATEQKSEDYLEYMNIILKRRESCWKIFDCLISFPSIAVVTLQTGTWLELLGIVSGFSKFTSLLSSRVAAANILSCLLLNADVGSSSASLLNRFLPPSLIMILKEDGGDRLIQAFDKESETPELIWNENMREDMIIPLADQLEILLEAKKTLSGQAFTLPQDLYVKYKQLENEYFIGGVYVRLFLKKPTLNLREPTNFFNILMKRWSREIENLFNLRNDAINNSDGNTLSPEKEDTLQLFTNAAICLCSMRMTLADNLTRWGYMPRLNSYLQRLVRNQIRDFPLISTIQILNICSARKVNLEALSSVASNDGKNGIVDYMIQAIGSEALHPDAAYMLEVLKNIFKGALGDLDKANESKGQKYSCSAVEEQIRTDTMTISNEENVNYHEKDSIKTNDTQHYDQIDDDYVTTNAVISNDIENENDLPLDTGISMPLEPPPPLPSEPPPPPPPPPPTLEEEIDEPQPMNKLDDNNSIPGKENMNDGIDDDPSRVNVPYDSYSYTPTPILGGGVDTVSNLAPSLLAERQTISVPGAPGSIDGRAAFLHSALQCLLPEFLVQNILENPQLTNIKDPIAAKAYAIELLKLLTMDPGFGMKFMLILDCLPNWKKYESQDHSCYHTCIDEDSEYLLAQEKTSSAKVLDFH